ncbi:LacI family DNA-binding transcriptional regulator [uncultured Faecalibaculum sp.]|uniref:LacI family DNA-binding transcriptional regulator n=1 Tax=uncultured Faecalibaculum sp. TaxID=1729681 RepID=UPI0025DF81CA|nr:LacI family DNA-binding transcriptional regulator [uncultured Faecalibaculum sp.]
MEKIRLRDIAEALGLSTATVSNVLNGKDDKVSPATRARVMEAVERSGYLPDRAEVLLGRNPSRMAGLVVNDHPEYSGHPLEDPYNAAFIDRLQKAAVRQGLELLVKTARTWEEAAQFASMWNMVGLVVSGFCDADYVSLKQTLKIPLTACDAFSTEAGFSSVTVKDREGGRLAGMHLKSLGHRRVTCVTTNLICDDLERIQGLRDAGLETDVFMISGDRSEMRRQFGERDFSRDTAVFCVSDRQALELLCILQERGIRVPEDLSVMGFDGIEPGLYAIPPLTTISQDLEAKARLAIESLSAEPAAHPTDVSLTVRKSTGYAKDIL